MSGSKVTPAVLFGKVAPSIIGGIVGFFASSSPEIADRFISTIVFAILGNIVAFGLLFTYYWLVAPEELDAERQLEIDALKAQLRTAAPDEWISLRERTDKLESVIEQLAGSQRPSAFVRFGATGNIVVSQNVASIMDSGAGDYTINFELDFDTPFYGIVQVAGKERDYEVLDQTARSVRLRFRNGDLTEPVAFVFQTAASP